MSRISTFRRVSLVLAEAFDAWRVVPRAILVAYGWMVWMVSSWYMSIPSTNEVRCQADVLRELLDQGSTVEQARSIACTVVETIGGPTSEQTMFVSILTGLSSVVIGLYLNTGKTAKWQGSVIDSIQPTNTLASSYRYGEQTKANDVNEFQTPYYSNSNTPEEFVVPGDEQPLSPDPADRG